MYECGSVVEWYWGGGNCSAQTKTCPSVTLFITDPTLTGLGSNPGNFGKRQATNCRSCIIYVVEKVYVYKFVTIKRTGVLNHWIKWVGKLYDFFLSCSSYAKSKNATLLSWHKDEILKHRREWEHNLCVPCHFKPGIKQSIHGSFRWSPFLNDKITREYLSWGKPLKKKLWRWWNMKETLCTSI
jgi:hypothetical protein